MMQLKDKVVVITGSTRGYGLACAHAFFEAGARVAVTGRSQDAVDRSLRGLDGGERVAGFVVDVREESQVHALARQVVERFGRFDIWINNAGYSSAAGMVLDMDPREALDMFLSNDLGVMHGTQAAMRHFLPRREGMLVNIYGNGSFLRPATPTALYGTTKAWLTSFTRSLAKENKGTGVKILGFSPGMMSTDMLTSPRVVGERAQAQLKNFGFVLRMLSRPAGEAARRLVETVRSQRKEFAEYHLFKPWTPLVGLIRVGWENLTGTGSAPEFTLKTEPAYQFKEQESGSL
jgi:NAD(P)-dependent dehydrogenase (short-subunit alcohol dehydrogenase family)